VEALFLQYQSEIYTCVFFGTFSLVALWEMYFPRRSLVTSLRTRWAGNIGVLVVNTTLTWLIYPGFGFAAALLVAENNWGLLNWLSMPYWASFVAALIILDLGHFLIHFAFHKIPLLWRAHRLHHTDPDFDITTGIRFHPAEAILEHGANLLVIVLVGPPVGAVIVFITAYLLTTFWVHGNIVMPRGSDKFIRRLFVTPEMHRTHHSEIPRETDSNYGGLFSFWDKLFGTYVDEPQHGHEGMTIGLKEFRDERHITLGPMLANPLLSKDIVKLDRVSDI
jgi:sterol desaturase/sphingolipid hydroxylase (fatty acid hydroxylase superfamily)